jgi:hypothetical protein
MLTDIDATPSGKKYDGGKLRLDLVPFELQEGVAMVLAFGADKYGEHNWKGGIHYSRIFGAVLRHLWAWWRGENLDKESGMPHLWHAACGVGFLCYYTKNGYDQDLDDRYVADLDGRDE